MILLILLSIYFDLASKILSAKGSNSICSNDTDGKVPILHCFAEILYRKSHSMHFPQVFIAVAHMQVTDANFHTPRSRILAAAATCHQIYIKSLLQTYIATSFN